MFSRGRGDPGRGRMENAPGDRVMIRVGDETVSVTLIEENPGLERARKVGRGRWCKKDNEHDISRCSFLHKKGAVPTDRRDLGAAVDAVLELAFSDDPVADILSNEEIRAGFSSTIQQSGANARLLKIVHRIMEIDEAEDTSTEVRDLQLLCDTWIIRCSSDMGKLQTWNGETQRQLFALVYGACKKDPFSPDNREALRTTADLPGVPDVSRREAEQFLLDTEREAAEANVADGENEVGNTRRFVVSPMYGDDIASLAETSAKPQTATELCMGSMRLEDLPRLVVDRFIPHQLRGLHIRALFHLSRADCTHALGLAIKLAEERGPESLLRRNADGSGLRIYATTMTFSGILAHPSHGVVGNMIPHGRRHSAKSKFMPGDLVVMWPSSEGNQYTEPAIGIVKRILDDGGVHISFVDILHALPVVSGGVSLVVARCPTFYLPTEASLLTLRKREYDIANNKEPPLLCACLTGVGSTDPPLYLQGNPRILLGPFVALARPSTDEQYVLDTWNGERWSVALEGSTTEESGGTKALLDGTQLGALQHMFRNRVAIVQGTPGTGKSFTSTKFLQILLRNKKRLRIGPIIIMTYTHHALEASLKSLLQLVDRSDHRIGVFAPRDESLMQYGIRLHSSPLDTEGLTSVLKDFMSIVKATRINPDLEKQILAVMQKHGPHMRCTAYTRTRHNEMVSVLGKPTQDYWSSAEEVRNRVVAETGWRPPRTLHDLEAVAAALRRNEWIDVVDLVPHLTKICGDRGAQFENAVQEEKKREKKRKKGAQQRQERLKALLQRYAPEAEGNLIDNTVSSILEGVKRLISIEEERRNDQVPYLEQWRTEGGVDIPLPPFADVLGSGAHGTTALPDDGDGTVLEQFESERMIEELVTRGLENPDNDPDTPHQSAFSLLQLPPIEARRQRVQDALNAMENGVPGKARTRAISTLLCERLYMLQEQINGMVLEIERRRESLMNEDSVRWSRALSGYDVIGATSTKMMTVIDAIQKCGASVLLVEEAAEVLESHLLSCITEGMQHIVLVGDHKQLRPKVSEFRLESRHNFAVSTMERLVLSGLPCVTLTTQRRMAPVISDLTKPYYSNPTLRGEKAVLIEDHPRTEHKKQPRGVCRSDGTPYRLYFVDHSGEGDKRETMCDNLASPENSYEADMAVSIARYLFDRNPSMGVTILVPYTGQKFVVYRKMEEKNVPRRNRDMRNEMGIRLSTIDDYQGEEDDIIILSLVRTEKPGFLRTENRSCVALSRARCGLYVIGCSRLLSNACPLWKNLVDVCRRSGCIGTHFPARCDRHLGRDLRFGSAMDYERTRARCPEDCNAQLDCGHICMARCHSERPHPPCVKPCRRIGEQCMPPRVCGHPCDKTCGKRCGKCNAIVSYTHTCGHTVELKCFQLENVPPCTTVCKKEAACHHFVEASCLEHTRGTAHRQCVETCGKPTDCRCDVGRCRQKCGHTGPCSCRRRVVVTLPCNHESEEFECGAQNPPTCAKVCGKPLHCGHGCSGLCALCQERKFHAHCADGTRTLMCGHVGRMGCSDVTGFCDEACEFQCGHGIPCSSLPAKKKHICSECPSRRCTKKCVWRCPHGECSEMCWEPCQYMDKEGGRTDGCWRRCEKKIKCDHQCCGLCGEECPEFCWECYKSGDAKMVALSSSVETFTYDREEVCRGDPADEGEEPPYLAQMQCCQKFIPARELYKSLESMDESVRVCGCPFCKRTIIPLSFRHGGPLLKRRLDEVYTVQKKVREGVLESREGSKEYTKAVVKHLKASGGCADTDALQSRIVSTRNLLANVQLQCKHKKRDGHLRFTGVLASFRQQCRELSVSDGWVALLCYYLNVTEYVLCNLQREKEIWNNAHRLARAALILVRMWKPRTPGGGNNEPGDDSQRFCQTNLAEMVPDVGHLSKRIPSIEDGREVERFVQRIEWTEILYKLKGSIYMHSGAELEKAKRFAKQGVHPHETALAKSLKEKLEKPDVTGDMLKNVARAINLVGGHWFKCPNGHFYVVGECGSPAESSRCPECGKAIGGVNYLSVEGNTRVGAFR